MYPHLSFSPFLFPTFKQEKTKGLFFSHSPLLRFNGLCPYLSPFPLQAPKLNPRNSSVELSLSPPPLTWPFLISLMASREATPPPFIGKAGNLTVFITPSPKRNPNLSPNPTLSPSPTPKSSLSPSASPKVNLTPSPSPSPSPKLSPSPRESPVSKLEKTNLSSPVKEKVFVAPPPVQVPPKQYEKGKDVNSHGSAFGFFWDAVARVQEGRSEY